jgi:integrase
MASIRRRGKHWQVRGEGRSKTFTLREDAKRYALELDRRKQLGSRYEAPPETFGSFLDAFIERKQENGARPRTVQANKEQARYLEPLRSLPVTSIRAAEVEDLVSSIRVKASAGKALALLKSSLRAARRRGHAIDEAILELKPPRYESREAKFLTLKQLYELSSWMPEWCKRIVPVAGLTGLRQGELFDLRESDLDLDGARLYVRQGKTKAAKRTVHLSAEAVRLLREQLVARPHSSLVFPTKTGLRHENSCFMGRYFRPATVSAGHEGLTFHMLRHSAISLMCLAGMRPEHIAAQVGHVDGGALILRRYRHLYDQEREEAVALLDALVVR